VKNELVCFIENLKLNNLCVAGFCFVLFGNKFNIDAYAVGIHFHFYVLLCYIWYVRTYVPYIAHTYVHMYVRTYAHVRMWAPSPDVYL